MDERGHPHGNVRCSSPCSHPLLHIKRAWIV